MGVTGAQVTRTHGEMGMGGVGTEGIWGCELGRCGTWERGDMGMGTGDMGMGVWRQQRWGHGDNGDTGVWGH